MSDNTKTLLKGIGLCAGGIGANAAEVDVKDDKIVRIRPMQLDKKYDPQTFNPWRIKSPDGKIFEPTTRSLIPPFSLVYKKRTYSPNRILYPMKRVDWDPNGDRNTKKRGESKYVRITWDEATDIIAAELKRIQSTYGPTSVLVQGDGHGETKAIHGPHGCSARLLDKLGGYTIQARQPDSWEGWYWGAKHVWGCDPVGQGYQNNLWKDTIENTKMLLMWGADPETTTWSWGGHQASRLCFFLREIGIRNIYICPDVNYACGIHADKWIPVLPNTDIALQLAIAYTWIVEDTYDKEYVATHTVGFEYIKKHVLGEDDGIPKTPKWAEGVCGVPSRTIKALARKWAKEATAIGHCNGGSFIRSAYAHEPGRYEVVLLGMQGLGKPGTSQLKFIEWGFYGIDDTNPVPRTEMYPNVRGCYNGWDKKVPAQFITKTLVPQAILGDYTEDDPLYLYGVSMAGYPREDQFVEYQYPEKGCAPIHMIWTDSPCWTTCWNGGNHMIQALRSEKIEFILAQHPWLENDCLFADIILPINTKMEEEDMSIDNFNGQYNMVFYEGQAIEPLGESKSDWEAVAEIAKKFDLYDYYVKGMTVEDYLKEGYKGAGLPHYISYEEFRDKEYFVIPTAEGWEDDPPGFSLFYKDPEKYPLKTPSGKLEFYSQDLADNFPDDEERGPYPKWIPYGESHQESLLHSRSEKFPFLIVSNHPRWRCHANLDDVSWLREIPTCKVVGPDGYQYEPVWINPKDAAMLGITDGDVVKVYNDRGWVLGGAIVTERITPGVLYQDHGARLDPIEVGVSDRAGSNNLICPTMTTSKYVAGEVTSGFLVGIEKVDVFKLAQQYPEAFSRVRDKTTGNLIDAWLIEEGGR